MLAGGVLGLDLARSYGWAYLDPQGRYVASDHRHLDGKLGEKSHHLHLSIADLVTRYSPDWVAVEQPHSPHYGAARTLFAYAAIAALVAHVRECGYVELGRAECCKAVLGAGRISKEDGIHYCQRFKPSLTSDDEADAILVALTAHQRREHK
jgi:Holliday junction resolvasome RuvABC endonuclease subunit